MTINTQNQSDLASRLRCRYPMGPIGDNGEPEFGWRDFSGPAPEGMVLPTQIMLDAADALDAQTAEIARLRGLVAEMAEHGTYETEYDGRMYSICHGCGAQDDEEHRDPNCLYVRARAALSGESK